MAGARWIGRVLLAASLALLLDGARVQSSAREDSTRILVECGAALGVGLVGALMVSGPFTQRDAGRGVEDPWRWEKMSYRPDFAVLNHRGSAICGRHVLE